MSFRLSTAFLVRVRVVRLVGAAWVLIIPPKGYVHGIVYVYTVVLFLLLVKRVHKESPPGERQERGSTGGLSGGLALRGEATSARRLGRGRVELEDRAQEAPEHAVKGAADFGVHDNSLGVMV